MIDHSRKDISTIIRDGTVIDRAIEAARRRVVRRHKQLGVPLVIWQNGTVAEIAPDTVAIPEEGADTGGSRKGPSTVAFPPARG